MVGARLDVYWRGPIWMNTAWLLWRGLTGHGRTRVAGEIATSMLHLVRRSGWREYYDPFGSTATYSARSSATASCHPRAVNPVQIGAACV